MRIAVVSKWKGSVERDVSRLGVKLDRRNPDFVLCVGGDGTFLYGEMLYPEVPKVLISHKCSGCGRHDLKGVIENLRKGQYRMVKDIKLAGTVNGSPRKRLVGLNDINVHYRLPCAIGLEVKVNGKTVSNNLGDGIIVSTPFGSTGYFSSITRKTFKKGIGIAFNNTVRKEKHLVVGEKSVIKAKVTRGAGYLASDCNRKTIPLKLGDRIEIRKHVKDARIVQLRGRGKRIVL